MTSRVVIRMPDDCHLHVRQGPAALAATIPLAGAQCSRAVIMPNTRPPIRDLHDASEYRGAILEAAAAAVPLFNPLMTLYLTDGTTPAMIAEASLSGIVVACKLYPAGATTNSSSGVTDISLITAVLDSMQQHDLPLLIHSEVTDTDVDIFDRERVFIERHIIPLIQQFPRLRIVLEHITTKFAADFVAEHSSPNLAATITPHHLLYNRNALFKDGLQPHWYCLPILKSELDRQALLKAATSGSHRFFMGTDSAPHAQSKKESSCGCAGCFVGYAGVELYAEAFDSVGKLHMLEDFTSTFGARFYGLLLNSRQMELIREEWIVPACIEFDNTIAIPFRAGFSMQWKIVKRDI